MKKVLIAIVLIVVVCIGLYLGYSRKEVTQNDGDLSQISGDTVQNELNGDSGNISGETSDINKEEKNVSEENDDSYLNLNKASLDSLMNAKGYSFSYDNLGNYELGKIKIGDSEYTLVVSNVSNSIKLILKENNEEHKLREMFDIDGIELTMYNDKYLLVACRGTDNDAIKSSFCIYDENASIVGEKYNNLYYNNSVGKFDYRISGGKIVYSAYEGITEEERIKYNIDEYSNLHRAYYEVIEENGNLKINKVGDDFKDLAFTCAA